MKLNLLKSATTLIIIALLPTQLVLAQKQEVEVPVLIDLGLGFGQLDSEVDITSNDQKVYVFKPSIAGTVEADTIKKFKHKLPENAPKFLLDSEISYSPLLLPDSIYFTSSEDGSDKVYGFSIGPDVGVGGGFSFLTFGVNLGARLTYLYMENDLFDENHFISLGAEAGYTVTLEPLKYLEIDFGRTHIWHIEDQLSNDKYLGAMTESYVMFHFRFPYDAKVKL